MSMSDAAATPRPAPLTRDGGRTAESGLSILVVAIVVGLVGEALSRGSRSLLLAAVLGQGWGLSRIELVVDSILSVDGALWAASAWGIVIGLWRWRAGLARGRARTLASWALGLSLTSRIASTLWTASWVFLARSYEARWFPWLGSTVTLLFLVAEALLVVALFAGDVDGRLRPNRVARIAAVAAALVGQVSYLYFLQALLHEHPAWNIVVGTLIALLEALALLAVALPVRRGLRAALAAPVDAGDAGPYRAATVAPLDWRELPELPSAGAGLDRIKRNLTSILLVMLVGVPIGVFMSVGGDSDFTVFVALALAAVCLVFSALIAVAMVEATRWPLELAGRRLVIAAALLHLGALATSLTMLVEVAARSLHVDSALASTGAGESFGSLVAVFSTVLLVVALLRGARQLGDDDVARRARAVLWSSAIGGVVAVGIVWLTVSLVTRSRYGFDPSTGLLAIYELAVLAWAISLVAMYLRLLRAGAKMLGFGREYEPR